MYIELIFMYTIQDLGMEQQNASKLKFIVPIRKIKCHLERISQPWFLECYTMSLKYNSFTIITQFRKITQVEKVFGKERMGR